MPTNTTSPITHPQAIEAMRVLATLASNIPAATRPSFTYANRTDPTSPNVFGMTSGNSIPAMVVWLSLVTNPDFTAQLASPATSGPLKNQIASAVGLTPQGVEYVLNAYLNSPNQQSYLDVANDFQTLSPDYRPPNCPRDISFILQLGSVALATDPSDPS